MAGYNEIQHGRFNRYFQKLTGIKGRGPVKQLGGELTPVILFPSGAEDRIQQGWGRFGVYDNIPAGGAGTSSNFRMRNPSTSNAIAVIEKIAVAGGLSAGSTIFDLGIGAQAADLGTAVAPAVRTDARGQPKSTMILSQQNVANVPIFILAFGGWAVVDTGMHDLLNSDFQELVIAPGDAFEVRNEALASNLLIWLLYRERFLEEAERT